ncbi:MAG: hypothetical protein ACLGI5_04235 [Thermoleophilia bacterium]
MKKLAIVATLAAAAVAVPAQASKPDNPGAQRAAQANAHEQGTAHRGSSSRAAGKGKGRGKGRCAPRSVGYVAFGDFVSSALTQSKGADTETTRDDRWSGELVVAVKRTNRHARADKGTTKTYTLQDAKLRLADRDGDGSADVPVAGDRTRVKGKITRLNRGCDATGFTAEVKVRAAGFHKPKAAEMPAPESAPAS